MPYIPKSDRKQYQHIISELAKLVPEERMSRPGHMNYLISLLINKVYGSDIRYADHNEVIGMLTCVKDEFYRRNTAPYEDLKIYSEGDLTEV